MRLNNVAILIFVMHFFVHVKCVQKIFIDKQNLV